MDKIKIPLFPNKIKKKDSHPDYTFNYKQQDGEWLNVAAAWESRTKDGRQYISVQIDKQALSKYLNEDQLYASESATFTEEDLDDVFGDLN